MAASAEDVRRYRSLDLSQIPDDEFTAATPASAWLKRAVRSPPGGGAFPKGSMAKLHDLPFFPIQLERCLGFSLYYAVNFVPLSVAAGLPVALYFNNRPLQIFLVALAAWVAVLYVLYRLLSKLQGWGDYAATRSARLNQYSIGERNTQIYHCVKFVWPDSLHPPESYAQSDEPVPPAVDDVADPDHGTLPTIFCVIPHSVLPAGILSYPYFSKLFSPRLCRWTAAPVIFKIPVVSWLAKSIGSIPAKSGVIQKKLKDGDADIGVVLDGIAGMFVKSGGKANGGGEAEQAYIRKRKGIVAIALKVGDCQIVPAYGFGHSSLWTILQDPFGVLRRLSIWLNVSLVAFVGRWGWPMGPSRRLPVMLAFGDPIVFPANPTGAKPDPATVEEYHKKLVVGFKDVFDTHKASFGWGDRQLEVV